MSLPDFDADGNMPPGVYPVTLAEAVARFGGGSAQRRAVAGRLDRIYRLAASSGHLARFVVFGSFVTDKPDPHDLDVVLIMADSFDLSAVGEDVAVVFRHGDADAQFGASVFWSTRSGAFGGEQAMVEYWQATRAGGQRGIIEVVPEKP